MGKIKTRPRNGFLPTGRGANTAALFVGALLLSAIPQTLSAQTASSIHLTTSANPVAVHGFVTFTATVTPSTASGTVTFKDLDVGAPLGTATIGSGGVALLTTSSLKPGLRSIVATYGGDTNDSASGSVILYQEVTPTPGVTFSSNYANPIPAGLTPDGTATGDFNGDGIPDLAVVSKGGTAGTKTISPGLTILLGNAAGGFTVGPGSSYSTTPVSVGTVPESVAVGDFNNDGKLDLLVVNDSATDQIYVLLGDGSGGFSPASASPITITVSGNGVTGLAVAVGDFNGDGNLDLVYSGFVNSKLNVLLGNGQGGFGADAQYTVAGNVRAIAVGDFNEDGKLDIAAADTLVSKVTVLLGDGSGGFPTITSISTGANTEPTGIATGDFNGDGHLDLATSNTQSGNVTVLLGDGTGAFPNTVLTTASSAGTNPKSIVAGDFNGDGILDLAVADSNTASASTDVYVLIGSITPGTPPIPSYTPSSFETETSLQTIMAGDFNGDGILDLVVASNQNDLLSEGDLNSVDVLWGTPTIGAAGSTNTKLTSSANPVVLGASVTLTATITPNTASGGVAFQDLGTSAVLGYAPIGNGFASFTTSSLLPGLRPIGAFYGGDASHSPSSSLLYQEVTPNGSTTFKTGAGASSYPTSDLLPFFVQGDFNNDGIPDLVIASEQPLGSGPGVTVLLGDGAGGFTGSTATTFNLGSANCTPVSLAVADFDGDGNLDVAVGMQEQQANGCPSGSDQVYILPGNGAGSFSNLVTAYTGGFPSAIAVGDFNGDGHPDLAITVSSSNRVAVVLFTGFLGGLPLYGTPTLVPVGPNGVSPESIVTGDFNGDGILDLATTNSNSAVTVLLGNGTGGFTATAASPIGVSGNVGYPAVGDFNGDGKLDLVVAGSTTVTVLTGDGSGGLTPLNGVAIPTTLGITVGDFNGDGILDVAASGNYITSLNGTITGYGITLLTGNGSGGFTVGSPIGAGVPAGGSGAILAADFNRDGIEDIATFFGSNGYMTVLLGQTTATTTTVSSSLNPSNYGQSVSFTATVTPSAAIGTVQFVVDGVNFGSPVAASGGTATSGATSTLSAGSHTVTANFVSTRGYGASSGSLTSGQTVNQATPQITWAPPAAITQGTPLSATQLDAAANVPGTFAYNPVSGTVLSAGAGQTLSVTFTPTDAVDYTTATGSTTITVNPAAPTAPTVVSYSVVWGAKSYNVTGSSRNRLPWAISGIQVVFSETIPAASTASLAGVTATGLTGLGTNTLTWTFAPVALGNLSTALSGSGTNAIKDASGNALAGGAGYSKSLKILEGDFDDNGVVNATDLAQVSAAISAPYNVLADMNGDGAVTAADVTIVRTRVGTSLQ